MSAQTVWLMAAAASAAVKSAAANSAAASSAGAAGAASASAAIGNPAVPAAFPTGAAAAETAPVGSSSSGGDNSAAAATNSSAASVLSAFQTVPAAPGTPSDGDTDDSDGNGDSTPAVSDRPRASTDVSSSDLSTLAQLVRGVSSGNPQTAGVERSIGTPVTAPGWSRDMAAQVQMMASAKVQSATLRLSPEHLGPVEVHIDMQSSQINVNFVAAHPDTRSALEQSVPTLRAMLAHGGLTLGQTQVQGEARSGSQSGGRARDNALPAAGDEPIAAAAVRGAGLIDEYA
jgi:flagellar hook-length control protein FliK